VSTEAWLPVVGWEAWYEVSDLGRVRRIDYRVNRPVNDRRVVTLLSPSLNSGGYLSVILSAPGVKRRTRVVHLLVADAFLGPRAPGLEIDHVDMNRANPRLANLEAVTHRENVRRSRAARRTATKTILAERILARRAVAA
jgi:hypothetical protein